MSGLDKTPNRADQSLIVAFLAGHGPDHAGRKIDEIWSWDHRKLEMVHDYIQWLFPLTEPSRFNAHAPLLAAADIVAIRSDQNLQRRVRQSLDLMIDFLGLERGTDRIARAPDYVKVLESQLAALQGSQERLLTQFKKAPRLT